MLHAKALFEEELKKPGIMALFILSFFGALSMGYLSSRDFSGAGINWVAQSINTITQLLLLIGACSLRKAGLDTLELD